MTTSMLAPPLLSLPLRALLSDQLVACEAAHNDATVQLGIATERNKSHESHIATKTESLAELAAEVGLN